jgi:hypothetical protein
MRAQSFENPHSLAPGALDSNSANMPAQQRPSLSGSKLGGVFTTRWPAKASARGGSDTRSEDLANKTNACGGEFAFKKRPKIYSRLIFKCATQVLQSE